jgi:ubiquinone biosynthesis protein UbiJ
VEYVGDVLAETVVHFIADIIRWWWPQRARLV